MVDTTIVNIAATMSTERNTFGLSLVTCAAFGIGLFLFVLAAQRAAAYCYVAFVPSEVDRALASGRPLSEAMLANARKNYMAALDILPNDAELLRNYGRLELRLASPNGGARENYKEAMNSAEVHFQKAILAAPSDAFSWSLASYVLLEVFSPVKETNDYLRMSYFLGPHEGSSVLLRARVASQLWDQLDIDVQHYTRSDFKTIWQHDGLRQNLIEIYLNAPLRLRVVIREVIITNEYHELAFNKLLIAATTPPQAQ